MLDFTDSSSKSFTNSGRRTVYCFGETVLDIIFRDGQAVAAKPGGSMMNTAVSLGRSGARVEFISEIAHDHAGEVIVSFLHENNVGTQYLSRYDNGKTTIALAFLDDRADATYSFYSDLPDLRLNGKLPVPGDDDIVLFGSFFSLSDGIHEKLHSFLAEARKNKVLVLYDPNFRKPHLADLPRIMPRILENFSCADIIRGSDEDFLHIFASRDAGEAYASMNSKDNQVLIYTRSDEPVNIISGKVRITVPVPGIKPVSTIGAGDSFNAGLIHALLQMGKGSGQVPEITPDDWKKMVENGIRFSQNVCMSMDNYISKDLLTFSGK
jgi:fructokinase